MREILFRGKRVDNGEWVCSGNLIHFNEYNECHIPTANSECTCTHDENNNIIEWKKVMFCKVLPETVGQYTGLTDKNGKKIFEGDIIKHYIKNSEFVKTYVVAWEDRLSKFVGKYIGDEYYGKKYAYAELHENLIYEVIGNIHDNPELLEQEG